MECSGLILTPLSSISLLNMAKMFPVQKTKRETKISIEYYYNYGGTSTRKCIHKNAERLHLL